MRLWTWLLVGVFVWMSAACAPRGLPASQVAPNAPDVPSAPNAPGAFLVWTPADVIEGRSAAGAAVDTILVHGGEIARLELARAGVSVGERVRAGAGFAETWSNAVESERITYVRATAFATALLLPRGSVARAYMGHASDPGYYWFDLEARVLAWAAGPLPAPFPRVAPSARVDVDGFMELDRVLEEAVARAGVTGRERANEAARAIRRVAGLRAVRALRPPVGYPYFFDLAPSANLKASADAEGHPWYSVAREPLELGVDGPAILHVWTKALRDDHDATVDLRILEGDRERAASASPVAHVTAAKEAPVTPETLPLRRALVHVPPGHHTYRVELRGGAALVYPLVAMPVVHLEDAFAGVKREVTQLAAARAACTGTDAPALCALALALLGEDHEPSRAHPPGSFAWREALAASPARARAVAETLAAGGPRDPAVDLELRATHGDAAALAKLSELVASSTDAVLRTAWAHAMMRSTRWSVVHREPDAERWTSVSYDERGDCAARAEAPWPEVTSDEHTYATARWHGVPVVDLLVSARCTDPNPIELAVDGEHLLANPSNPFVHWHVRVREESARVALVRGSGHVYALPRELSACNTRWEAIHAPRSAASGPKLTFDPADRSPGLEIWLGDGDVAREVRVLPLDPAAPVPEGIRIVASPAASTMMALDGEGRRWRRAARVALPAWARGGVTVRGGDDVAVRALVRVPRVLAVGASDAAAASRRPAPATLDEPSLVALTRRLLEVAPAQRGPLYLERALMLAAAGAARSAREDAEAAHALGTRGPHGEDALELVRTAIRPRTASVDPLPTGRAAYGVEPDFEPNAPRCGRSGEGPRARLARIADELAHAENRSGGDGHAFSPALAARVVEAVQEAPLDPRGPGLVARALASSRWKLRANAIGAARRVTFPREAQHRGPVDGDGELRPRVAAGTPFDEGSFATIAPGRPAKALLSAAAGSAARLDVACVARDAAAALEERCPLEISLGGRPPLRPSVGTDGRATVPLTLDATPRPLVVSLSTREHRWLALTRIVFDKPLPGTTRASDGAWVLAPPHVEHRYVVEPGHEISAPVPQAGLLRIDAIATDGPAEVVVDVQGRRRAVPTDGTPVVIALPEGGRVSVRPTGHAVSLAFAERVANEPREDLEPADLDADRDEPPGAADAKPALLLDPAAAPPWRDEARRSPRPLTPLESSLGTAYTGVGAVYGTIRDGLPSLPVSQSDGYVFALAEYRRRIESIGLWTNVGGYAHVRSGAPTYGAGAVLYEDLEKLHVRLSGAFHVSTQRIEGHGVRAIRARGFAEYSWRATRDFFVLPRLGYDGTYASLVARPKDLSNVDDNVFNPYRAKRPTFLFAQLLLWFAPYFDDIFYVRNRISYDALSRDVSHVSVRPGLFVALGQLDVSSFLDETWHAPTDSITNRARIDHLLGGAVTYNVWSNLGSLDVQPGLAGFSRLHDGGWQMNVFVNLLASYRRGLRDFSSLELDFPEQLGGGIPWRGATAGGYR